MKSKKYDVVVIGAGPSGSLCARNLATKGYSVLLCEKRPVVGVPVRCGEATGPQSRLSDFMRVNPDFIETSLTGVILHATGNQTIRYDADKEIGVMLDRKLFDQDIARQAVEAGAELCVNTRASALGPDEGGVRQVTLVDDDGTHEIEAAMVVGADGAESLSGRWAGLKTRQLPPLTCTAIEFRLKAHDANPNHLTFWQGHDSLNLGYIWVFPKVKSGVVNLGAGILTPKLGAKNMKTLTEEWHQKLFPGAELEEVHGGAVPVSGNLPEFAADRFLLCGDAAHHTNPLTGGGIMASLVAADAAAKWIDLGFRSGRLDREYLGRYEEECWNRFEARIRDFVLGLPREAQARFFGAFKTMVDGRFSTAARLTGLSRMGWLAATHPTLTRKAFFG